MEIEKNQMNILLKEMVLFVIILMKDIIIANIQEIMKNAMEIVNIVIFIIEKIINVN